MIERRPEDAQTLYAELLTLLLTLDADRGWSHLAGTFTEKSISGGDYIYFQYSDPGGKKRQLSIGLKTKAIEAILTEQRQQRSQHLEERAPIERLARLLHAAGILALPHAVARVLGALADAGVFRLGGVLVGSYAFSLVGNALGVSWPEAAWRTQDVDVASHLLIATPPLAADVPSALDSLQMGFVPVPQLDPRHASTSFKVRGKQLRVDLLTPGAEGQEDPVFVPRLRAAAAPIKYLSLLIDEAEPAPAIFSRGAVLVVIPTPARLALHKLLVSQMRSLVQQTKSGKDLHQAALLIEVLAEDRPDDLEAAGRVFAKSGPAVTTKVLRGLAAAEKRWPEVAAGGRLVRSAMRG
ncbi:MAG: nucleotidyltransferase domain-containing protein [Planctomycetota bacterium]|nr:nucleotidyltransferase domain-containing protein [Planctomycetota bacterium]